MPRPDGENYNDGLRFRKGSRLSQGVTNLPNSRELLMCSPRLQWHPYFALLQPTTPGNRELDTGETAAPARTEPPLSCDLLFSSVFTLCPGSTSLGVSEWEGAVVSGRKRKREKRGCGGFV